MYDVAWCNKCEFPHVQLPRFTITFQTDLDDLNPNLVRYIIMPDLPPLHLQSLAQNRNEFFITVKGEVGSLQCQCWVFGTWTRSGLNRQEHSWVHAASWVGAVEHRTSTVISAMFDSLKVMQLSQTVKFNLRLFLLTCYDATTCIITLNTDCHY